MYFALDYDLHDLEKSLQQTEGMGMQRLHQWWNVTWHGYPELNKYPHLVG